MKLRLSLVMLAGLACAGAFSASAAETKLNYAAMDKLGWKLSLQCWTFNSKTLFEAIDIANSLGIRYIEMFPGQKLSKESDVKVDQNMPADAVAALQKKMKEANVQAVCFGVCGIPGKEADARKLFEWAKVMGIQTIVSEPGDNQFDLIDKLAQEYQIGVACHNHPKPSHYWDAETVLKNCKGRSKFVGACTDTGHWYRSGLVSLECLKQLEGRVISAHFKDLNDKKQDVPWGTGNCNAKAMLAEYKRQGFKGVFSIEYEHWDENLKENVAKCCQFFSDTAGELAEK